MLIACPACQTHYDVPESALGAQGRTVRCAKCGNSWFADMERPVEPAKADDDVAQNSPPPSDISCPPSVNVDTVTHSDPPTIDDGLDEGENRGQPDEWQEGLAAHAEPPRSRRQVWLIALLVVAIIAATIYGAARMYGLPDWVPGSDEAFAAAPDNLEFEFPDDDQILQTTDDGARFFTASGTIVNTGSSPERVPPIQVILRDSQERIVYSAEMLASKRVLEPGESIALREAMTDIPRSARVVEIGWKSI